MVQTRENNFVSRLPFLCVILALFSLHSLRITASISVWWKVTPTARKIRLWTLSWLLLIFFSPETAGARKYKLKVNVLNNYYLKKNSKRKISSWWSKERHILIRFYGSYISKRLLVYKFCVFLNLKMQVYISSSLMFFFIQTCLHSPSLSYIVRYHLCESNDLFFFTLSTSVWILKPSDSPPKLTDSL